MIYILNYSHIRIINTDDDLYVKIIDIKKLNYYIY
jgi:hypothetical protein